MTAKEKAKELVSKYYTFIDFSEVYQVSSKSSKECALICVDEVLEELGEELRLAYNYWTEVKEEINKL